MSPALVTGAVLARCHLLPPSLLRRVPVLSARTFCSSVLSTVLLSLVPMIGRPLRPPAGSTTLPGFHILRLAHAALSHHGPPLQLQEPKPFPPSSLATPARSQTVPTAMVACAHAKMLRHLDRNSSQQRTFDFPGNAFVPLSPTNHAGGHTRSEMADLRNLPAGVSE